MRLGSSTKIKHPMGVIFFLAEELGFEPRRALTLLTVFETAPFNRLGIPPALVLYHNVIFLLNFLQRNFDNNIVKFLYTKYNLYVWNGGILKTQHFYLSSS